MILDVDFVDGWTVYIARDGERTATWRAIGPSTHDLFHFLVERHVGLRGIIASALAAPIVHDAVVVSPECWPAARLSEAWVEVHAAGTLSARDRAWLVSKDPTWLTPERLAKDWRLDLDEVPVFDPVLGAEFAELGAELRGRGQLRLVAGETTTPAPA